VEEFVVFLLKDVWIFKCFLWKRIMFWELEVFKYIRSTNFEGEEIGSNPKTEEEETAAFISISN